ncbi:MAG TPA: alcohol dehydrogenase catalytic domain-containing protein [Spirochaetia bacterium]|nr:alcohol dehydrogenase catalytic domain-containing protein [Spirochaetia bacterium]
MKAVILREAGRMELVHLPDEEPGPGEVLLKVEACSICGSDLEGFIGIHPKVTLPRVMGHEVACRVEALGAGVLELSEGDRVAGTGWKSCMECSSCGSGDPGGCERPLEPGFSAHGGYAEYMLVRPGLLAPIPKELSYEEAAVAQPASIAYHAVATRAAVAQGETVLVQGCGPIGLSAMMLSKLRGARVISTDIVDYRCRRAKELGADFSLNAHRDDIRKIVIDATNGQGVDKVIECVGGDQDETLAQAVRCVRECGLVVVVGSFAADSATIPVIDFKFKEKRIIGSQGMPEGYEPVFDLIKQKQLDVNSLITHRISLEQIERGLGLMDRKAEEVMKIVVIP